MIKQLQAERDTLVTKVAFLTEEHSRLTQLQQQKETIVQPPPEEENQSEVTESVTMESHEMEQVFNTQNFAQLQTNFAALQVRFTSVTLKEPLLFTSFIRTVSLN